MRTAADHWRDELHAWAMPQALLDAAPENPYTFPARQIAIPTVPPRKTPTGQRVMERVADDDRLLDIGCGAGRISGAFTSSAGQMPVLDVVGVEPRTHLADVAREAGLTVHEGRWPEMADAVGSADVVLSTHVLYDVDTPVPFIDAMHAAARRRVVIEVTATHPWTWIGPLFRRLHGLDRPTGPSADLLAEVITDAVGQRPSLHRWTRPRHRYVDRAAAAAQARRMLCLTAERDRDIEAAMADMLVIHEEGVSLPDQDLMTLWWDTDG